MIPRGAAPPCSLAARAADRSLRRAPHSFRHFHISHQLITGVDVFLLAKNTGTSSDMIERFYGQVKLERMAKELRPEWRAMPRDGQT